MDQSSSVQTYQMTSGEVLVDRRLKNLPLPEALISTTDSHATATRWRPGPAARWCGTRASSSGRSLRVAACRQGDEREPHHGGQLRCGAAAARLLAQHQQPADKPAARARGARRREGRGPGVPGGRGDRRALALLGDDAALHSKLVQALRAVRIAAGVEAAALTPASRPVVTHLTPEELQQHAALLRSYATHDATHRGLASNVGGNDEVIRSLHASWAACVADPSLRRVVLPVLFAIAKRPVANAPEREAALALCFLAFSLSGTVIQTLAAAPAPRNVVVILGWLGSQNEEFESLAQYFRTLCLDCTVHTTVGGSDRWADATPGEAAATARLPPPLFAEGSDASWPTAALCEEHLWRLAELILPPADGSAPAPKVLFHCFSNGFTLYVRLLRHLQRRAAEGEAACATCIAAIAGVVFDSTPAWGPAPAVIPPPAIVKLVATQAVAAVLKKESIVGMSMDDIGPRSPLKSVVENAIQRVLGPVFDSTWHYDWCREHEPSVPALFVYSSVDRTTRQDDIEQWLTGNKEKCGDTRSERGYIIVEEYVTL